MNRSIEIIVAVRNETDAVGWFVDELARLKIPSGFSLSVTFVEDGSTDETIEKLRQLSSKFSWVKFYSLEKGFGQIAAIIFGLSLSEADAQILMDVDGTHPVYLIPKMIEKFSQGVQIVQGHRKDAARAGSVRKWGAYLFRASVRWMTGVDLSKQTVYYRLIGSDWRRKVLADPRSLYFFRLRLPKDPAQVQFLEFEYEERTLGASKYPLGRLIRFAGLGVISLMTPLQFWTVGSCIVLGIGILAAEVSPFFLVFVPAFIWVAWTHWQMSHNKILQTMKVRTEGQSHGKDGFRAKATSPSV